MSEWTLEKFNEGLKLRDAGMSYSEIARTLDVDRRRLTRELGQRIFSQRVYGIKFSDEQLENVKMLRKAGNSARAIIQLLDLGCSEETLRKKLRAFEMARVKCDPRSWSKDEDEKLLELLDGGGSIKDAVTALGRTRQSVRHRISRLRDGEASQAKRDGKPCPGLDDAKRCEKYAAAVLAEGRFPCVAERPAGQVKFRVGQEIRIGNTYRPIGIAA